ncbi:MAG: acetate kinase [Alkalinema sp. CAN_BIN05]|nr:acetate kinase [Alkalinema sp. CAN_BIN05]
MNILVLNAGSSSQKMALYHLTHPLPDRAAPPLWEARLDWSYHAEKCEIEIKTHQGVNVQESIAMVDRSIVLSEVLDRLYSGSTQVIQGLDEIDIVGHRVVHGGRDYRESIMIDPQVKAEIDRLSCFAPIHNPANLAGIVAIEKRLGNIPQVAVFDTAFHSDLPDVAKVYPLPYEWYEKGIQRYGFHGISHEYCAHRSAELLNCNLQDLRLIICHLGNGCSLSAVRNGKSIDTTMGFTPLEGLMMGSRCGSIDPGILIHLLGEEHYTVEQLDHLLNYESGLQGLSGQSGDMRQILEAIAHNSRAKLAFEVYIYRLRAYIGAMLANLGGLDALVFTAGVGEHQPLVRSAVCEGLGFLGIQIDADRNLTQAIDQMISPEESPIKVLVVKTQEDWAIALECFKLWNGNGICV